MANIVLRVVLSEDAIGMYHPLTGGGYDRCALQCDLMVD
jgi:hypothetical protein